MIPPKSILLVDDDNMTRQLAEISLTKIGGYEVISCGSGERALELLSNYSPDVMLIDLNMPNMNGEETLLSVQSINRLAELPVIFITAESTPNDIDRLQQLGASGVIIKPFNPMTLPNEIEQILNSLV